uniref:NADH dehydrogenase subunit 2 n=1 Tax=Tagasta tonkinensis TaxID=316081 RepID=UPI0026E22E94|nr:NADH dehydrogenase subunit 2 [Tagasta tonkinensis]WJO90060.1 NADH dehydrogenase subunit 2 [Tagasta tonkinensis]
MNLKKTLFLSSLMMGSMISISSNTWLGIWMGLEMNLLSFIPLMVNEKNLMMNESSIKYFIVQVVASAMLLFSILMIVMKIPVGWEKEGMIPSMMISSSLLIKVGAAPFHLWFPEVMKTSSWINCMILMTWQKIAPMVVLSYCIGKTMFTLATSVSSIILGAIGGLYQTSIRQVMAYSSISHLGWMISSMLISELMWEFYFIIYSTLSSVMVLMFNQSKLYNIGQLFTLSSYSIESKFIIIISMLSLGGMPPLLGFLPKWLIVQTMLENGMTSTVSIMVILTSINIYYYMRISFASIILNSNESMWSANIKPKTFKVVIPMMAIISSLGLVSTTSLISYF